MNRSSSHLRVIIADDDQFMRDVLIDVFADDGRLEVVAAVGDADHALRAVRQHRPDLLLVDVRMPAGGGARVARELRGMSDETRVVALSSRDDRASIVEMFRAGAVSYLVKGDTTNRAIVDTLLQVARGEMALPDTIGHQLLREFSAQLERTHVEEEKRRATEARVRRVLAAGMIEMVYQPILDLGSGARRGLEALARINDPPTQGPDRWFADAAATGLGIELELLAIRSSIQVLGEVGDDTYLAVNVSPATAAAPEFQALVLDAAPNATVMEITEHAPIDDYDRFRREIEPLRSAGVRLAVDDAGAGFASLRHILLLAPDIIKLDLSLTRGIDADRNRRAMARALISFATETEASIVAEGIERDDELQALRELGVTHGQGYLLARPAPLEQLLASEPVDSGPVLKDRECERMFLLTLPPPP